MKAGCRPLINEKMVGTRYLEHLGKEYLEIDTLGGLPPYYLTVRQQYGDRSALRKLIKKVNRLDLTPLNLLDAAEAPKLAKYDEFIPPDLRRKAFVADELNLKELQAELEVHNMMLLEKGIIGMIILDQTPTLFLISNSILKKLKN